MSVLGPARYPRRLSYIVEIARFLSLKVGPKSPLFLLALAGGILVARPTSAEPSRADVLAIGEVPERVYATLDVRSDRVASRALLQRQRQRQRSLSALTRLNDIDAAMALARRATVALREDEALRMLARAEQLLLDTLELPGAAEHYAELQLQIGVSAAHGGKTELADAAFARAASVDPTRHLLAGEASPEVVSLARRAFERMANAREGVLHVHTNVTAARVFIDDAELGSAPLSVRIRSGVHVLRVEADDHTAYARLFDMLEGDRPALDIALSPEPLAESLQRLDGARSEHSASEIEAMRARVFQLEPTLELLVFGQRAGERGWFARCDQSLCTIVTYSSGVAAPLRVRRTESLSSNTLDAARAWMTPVVVSKRSDAAPLWQQWYVWAAAGAIVVSAGLWVGVATQPDPQHSLRASVDSSALR